MSYLVVPEKQMMTLDHRQNQVYYEALQRIITPDSVVLDLGAGLGILGLLAAKLGAKTVYLVESEAIVHLAKDIAQQNGFGDRIQCFQGTIEEVELPEPVDVIISAFTENFLLQEDLLSSVFYARDKYLKSCGVMIPNVAMMESVPVSAPAIYQKNIACWSEPHFGIDHSEARKYASQAVYFTRSELAQAQYLAPPATVLTMDFYQCHSNNCDVELSYKIEKSGLCHGWASWFTIKLGNQSLSTAPHHQPPLDSALDWSSAFLPLDPPLAMLRGMEVSFKLQRPILGDWSWQITAEEERQLHSSFFSLPLSLKALKQKSPDYQPQLSERGEAALYVLSHSDGSYSAQQLSNKICKIYPQLFPQPETALNFVCSLVSSLA